MSTRPLARSSNRLVVRATQLSRLQQEAVVRAYELALPIMRERLAEKPSAKFVSPRRSPCPTGRRISNAS
jgi:hypothetical protein